MADPPIVVRAVILPRASTPAERSRTKRYRSSGRAQGRRTGWAGVAPHSRRRDTTSIVSSKRIHVANSVNGISGIIPATGLFRQLSPEDAFSGECRTRRHILGGIIRGVVKRPKTQSLGVANESICGAKWLMRRPLLALRVTIV